MKAYQAGFGYSRVFPARLTMILPPDAGTHAHPSGSAAAQLTTESGRSTSFRTTLVRTSRTDRRRPDDVWRPTPTVTESAQPANTGFPAMPSGVSAPPRKGMMENRGSKRPLPTGVPRRSSTRDPSGEMVAFTGLEAFATRRSAE